MPLDTAILSCRILTRQQRSWAVYVSCHAARLASQESGNSFLGPMSPCKLRGYHGRVSPWSTDAARPFRGAGVLGEGELASVSIARSPDRRLRRAIDSSHKAPPHSYRGW